MGFSVLFDTFSLDYIQSRPIKMRAPFLYLGNGWMDSKMLLTPNTLTYFMLLLLLPFPQILQFIAHFWPFCLFLCSNLNLSPVATKWELEQSRQERKGGRVKSFFRLEAELPISFCWRRSFFSGLKEHFPRFFGLFFQGHYFLLIKTCGDARTAVFLMNTSAL